MSDPVEGTYKVEWVQHHTKYVQAKSDKEAINKVMSDPRMRDKTWDETLSQKATLIEQHVAGSCGGGDCK